MQELKRQAYKSEHRNKEASKGRFHNKLFLLEVNTKEVGFGGKQDQGEAQKVAKKQPKKARPNLWDVVLIVKVP